MCKITYSTEPNQIEFKNVDLGNAILKYDVIHDKFKEICNKNLKPPRNFRDNNSVGDMGTGRHFAIKHEIA